jgi:hypothetical protein
MDEKLLDMLHHVRDFVHLDATTGKWYRASELEAVRKVVGHRSRREAAWWLLPQKETIKMCLMGTMAVLVFVVAWIWAGAKP